MSQESNNVCCECQKAYAEIEEVIKENQGNPGALIQVLNLIQTKLGHVPRDLQLKVAESLGVSLADVYGIITFYSFFREKPRGKYVVSVCLGTACYVRGAPEVLNRLEKELGIKAGETTDDGLFTIEEVRCLGACGLAPVMTVNHETYGRVTEDQIPEVLSKYRNAEKSASKEVADS
jgi:NADH-quinone oxidoreductase E subunit